MKMVKSLLLGTAAGLVAIAGAQAADLPVKAKPVEYVKVCSLYGAGFYYIPGTDTCLKIGGYVRADFNFNSAPTHAAFVLGGGAIHTRDNTNDIMTRARGVVSFDARSQTEWGTLRSYSKFGFNATSGGDGLYTERAFIQLGGFTFGKASSFFDFYAGALGYATFLVGSDTAGSGKNVWAYTAQFGNGLSATLSLEDPTTTGGSHRKAVSDNTALIASPIVAANADNRGAYIPDIVGVLRVDQAWGSAQLSGAIHDASGAYYGTANLTANGHPSDKLGWGVQAGVAFNLPFAAGDKLFLQVGYGEGFTGANTQAGGFGIWSSDTSVGVGQITDGVFGTGTAVELTKSWSALAGIEHFWAPNLKTSVYGGYAAIDYNANATALICASPGTHMTVTNCNPDFSWWQVGARTQWTPVRNFDIGVEVLYTHLNTAFKGAGTVTAAGGSTHGAQAVTFDDQGTWSGLIRVQRNFWP